MFEFSIFDLGMLYQLKTKQNSTSKFSWKEKPRVLFHFTNKLSSLPPFFFFFDKLLFLKTTFEFWWTPIGPTVFLPPMYSTEVKCRVWQNGCLRQRPVHGVQDLAVVYLLQFVLWISSWDPTVKRMAENMASLLTAINQKNARLRELTVPTSPYLFILVLQPGGG